MKPLDLFKTRSPQDTGNHLADIATGFQNSKVPSKTALLLQAVKQELGLSDHSAVMLVAEEIADGVDHDDLMPDLEYHNAQHVRDVMISAAQLCIIHDRVSPNKLTQHDKELLITAALIHDLHHDGKGNGGIPFKLEENSVQTAKAYFDHQGVGKEDQAKIHAMVLATDIVTRHQPSEEICQMVGCEANEATLNLINLLKDADILPSFAWNKQYSQLQSARLVAETGNAYFATTECRQNFIANNLQHKFSSQAGQFFLPCLEGLYRGKAQKTPTHFSTTQNNDKLMAPL